jgi:hypothetical protein
MGTITNCSDKAESFGMAGTAKPASPVGDFACLASGSVFR